MTDLRAKIISIACALALVAGCMPAVAFAQEESATASPSPKQQANPLCDEAASSTLAASEDAPSPASTRIPIDRQAFAQAEDEGITLQSVNLNATVAPHDAFSDEFLYFTKYESGNRLTSGEGYDMLLSAATITTPWAATSSTTATACRISSSPAATTARRAIPCSLG